MTAHLILKIVSVRVSVMLSFMSKTWLMPSWNQTENLWYIVCNFPRQRVVGKFPNWEQTFHFFCHQTTNVGVRSFTTESVHDIWTEYSELLEGQRLL